MPHNINKVGESNMLVTPHTFSGRFFYGLKIMIEREDLIYTAGVMDCDGHIMVRYFKRKDRYSIAAGATNTKKALSEFLKDKFGGSVSVRKDKNPKHKTRYDWYISEKSAFPFIKSIVPYLKLKKEQAEIAMEFKKLIGKQGSKQSADNQQKRIELYSKVHKLNERGNGHAL